MEKETEQNNSIKNSKSPTQKLLFESKNPENVRNKEIEKSYVSDYFLKSPTESLPKQNLVAQPILGSINQNFHQIHTQDMKLKDSYL